MKTITTTTTTTRSITIQPAQFGKLKSALMRAVTKIDDMDASGKELAVLGRIANHFEEAALCLMGEDGAGAEKELRAAFQLGGSGKPAGQLVAAIRGYVKP